MTPGSNRNNVLLALVEELERLAKDKREINELISEVKKRAKSAGFDVKAIGQMLRERAMSPEDRQEHQALLDIYRAALGMLDGTPLGDAARKRLEPPPPPDSDEPTTEPPEPGAPPLPDAPAAPPTPEQIAAAVQEGAAAATAGTRVTANPYPAGDPRRAAWDEGWCAAAGSDGMDIPPAWRRTPKKDDKKGGPDGA